MKKLTEINNFKEGTAIQGFFLCASKNLRHTRTGDLFLDLELRDITGHIDAKIWDNIEKFNKKFNVGNAVAVSGFVERFIDHNQLIIRKINKATVQYYGRYGFDPARIVPSSKHDPKKMWIELEAIINTLKDKYLKALVLNLYNSNKKKIMYHPASINMHYNYRSGFLEHILKMAKISKKIVSLYNVDKDLVIAGVFLHKIGKIKEISSEYLLKNTSEGNLIGHNVLGRDMVRQEITRIKGFPSHYSNKIEHIILSHQGRYEWKSHKLPSFPEALLIHLIGFSDSRMNLMSLAIDNDKESGGFTNKFNYFGIPILKDSEIR